MSDVEFSDEETFKTEVQKHIATSGVGSPSKLSSLPVRLGLARDQTGANIILVVIGILAVLVAVLVFIFA